MFLELSALLPGAQLRLVLLGPHVPPAKDGASQHFPAAPPGGDSIQDVPCQQIGRSAEGAPPASGGGIELSFRRGLAHELYHGLVLQYGQPHLVIGPNAGARQVIGLGRMAAVASAAPAPRACAPFD